MSPNDEVQVTLTRMECMRVQAALSALVDIQKMVADTGLETAVRLTDAVDVIEGVLPRLREHWPRELDEDTYVTRYDVDTKSYSDTTTVNSADPKVADLVDISPTEALEIFGTEYDDPIRALLKALVDHTSFTMDDFYEILQSTKALMVSIIPIPKGMTVSQAMPYTRLSDLLALGELAKAMVEHNDEFAAAHGKPF